MRSNPCTLSMKNPPKRWPRTAVEETGLVGLADTKGAVVREECREYIYFLVFLLS